MKIKIYLSVFIVGLLFGCATYKSNQTSLNNKKIEHVDKETLNLFLIGDAGMLEADGSAPKALIEMQKLFSKADKQDVLLFLGDNIYPKGFPKEGERGHNEAKAALRAQTEIAKTFPGSVYFLPGNHDWYNGIDGLKLQEAFVSHELGKKAFQPRKSCGIGKVNLSDEVVMLIVDSQWYITNWNRHPTINDDCDIKTREDFLEEFRSEIKKSRGKTTLVAIHHPMYSSGPHAGRYNFKNHLKPLPVLGTLKNGLRTSTGIVNADISNRFYNDLRKQLITASQQNENVIFLSGHEHILGYFEVDNLVQIISGSASKLSPTRVRNKQDYSHGTHGYAILNIHKNQAIDVQFIDTHNNVVDFYKQIKPVRKTSITSHLDSFQEKVSAAIYSEEETQKSNFYTWLWGERFRQTYSTKVEAPTVNLDTLFGGLKPLRKGGGTQSKSLHLKNADGKRYVMRAMRKQASQFIQTALFPEQNVIGQFSDTKSEQLVEDVFTGSHPYVPLAVANLSEAMGIYHLNPKLYFIPKQNALGGYNTEFGDELYIVEEHPSEGHTHLANGNFTGNIVSTVDMLKAIHKDESHIVDEKEFVKVRLFDILIGDADRHQDQWRWMVFEEDGKTVYRPLARDRDLAFSKMSDGFLFGTAVALLPLARKFRKYEPNLTDIKGFNVSGYPLDVAFMSQIDKLVWDEQVQFLQQQLSDTVINEAFAVMPKEVQDEIFENIKFILKQRKQNLPAIADNYFRVLNRINVVTATNKDDFISINVLDNSDVEVSAFRKKSDGITDRFHHRTYKAGETREIWVYGLDDDDTFEVKGKSKKIKIRLIGGQNNDRFLVENGKNIVVYDYKSKKNNVEKAQKARVRLTDDYETNVYNLKKPKNNTNQFIPSVGYNPDDGVRLGFSNTYTVYGFERNPFTSQHRLSAHYYFATNGFDLNYQGEFAYVFGNLNLGLKANFHSPNFSINYFGYSNETKNNDDNLGMDYNRVKIGGFSIMPQLIWNSKRGSKAAIGIDFERVDVAFIGDRFIGQNTNVPLYLFDDNNFMGINGTFAFANFDNKAYPTNGFLFQLDTGFKSNLDQNGQNFTYLISKLGFARKLEPSGRLVLAGNLKGHFNFGDGFEFYQAASIGGVDGLRGFRNQRFTGKNAFYQNTDLRYSFNQLKTQIIPLKLGVFAGFDYGRVWIGDDSSKKWHNAYGGGFFINAVDAVSGNLGVFNSADGLRMVFGFGFGF
ncbi:MAG: metallophosphoesterase [Aestuariibaculum sp.]